MAISRMWAVPLRALAIGAVAVGALLGFVAGLGPAAVAAQTGGTIQWDQPRAELRGSIGLVDRTDRTDRAAWGAPAVTVYTAEIRSACAVIVGLRVTSFLGCLASTWYCDPSAPASTTNLRGVLPGFESPPPNFTGRPGIVSLVPIASAVLGLATGAARFFCSASGRPSISTPPTNEEIWQSVVSVGAPPVVELRPRGRGLTGLPTPLWMELAAAPELPIELSIRGWSVRGSLWLDRVEWRISDAATDTVVATEGRAFALGSADAPLSEFRFRTKGTYTVTGTAVWRARGTVVGPGGIARAVEFPEAGLVGRYDYPVDELVGILDRPR